MSTGVKEITVVGLGPGDPGLLTQQTIDLLRENRVYLRTRVHPTLDSIPESESWPSFDDLYERLDTFAEVYAAIVDSLIDAAARGPVVYAVPGHPLFGEATVRLLMERAEPHEVTVRILPAVSFLDVMVTALGLDPVDTNLQVVDALELVSVVDAQPYSGGQLPVSPLRPAIVAQIYSPVVASAVKLALLRVYPEDHQVVVVTATGTAQQNISSLALTQLDREPVDHLSSLYLPAVDPLAQPRVTEGLQRIIARLRAPGGCPWDREQTHRSLTRHMLEEAYELIHAIEGESPGDLAEELGDVLLQVCLHAQIAEEEAEFTLEDVIQTLTSKLVRRHPHVFGDRTIETAGEVVTAWDQIKQAERIESREAAPASLFDTIPPDLPALARAQTMLRRARSHGLDVWQIGLESVQPSTSQLEEREKSIALRLADLVAQAERSGVDAERALRLWTRRLERAAISAERRADD